MTLIAPAAADSSTPSSRRAERALRPRWRLPVLPLAIAVVCLLGILILMYPSVAGWFSQYEQSRMIDEYSTEVEVLGPEGVAGEIERAHAYNTDLVGGASVAAGERLPVVDGAAVDNDYSSLLSADDQGLMARLRVPSIGVDLPIYHGVSEAVLQRGVGHLEGTALPVGGEDTHAVLTAHRGLASSTLFTNLDQVDEGDLFSIEVFGDVLTYRVISTQVVAPSETETLYPLVGEDLVTLVTCTPLGINSHRILVTGERILPTPPAEVAQAGQTPDIPGFPWWTLILAAAALTLGLYVWWSGRPARRRRSRSAGKP
ncbi:class C sortase [Microbacterium terregens]|uniref:Class C sortase n=1 Tax=Microbacterium terregens TaxID=69363 RepID=A0ABV5SX50_9MICO